MKILLAMAAAFALAACTTPYPNADPFYGFGATVDANRAPRGSPAFCENYARQSAANFYEANRDSDDSFGSSGFTYRQAELSGNQAYRRCLAGRTN